MLYCIYAAFEMFDQLTEEDKEILRRETTHRWHQPKTLYALVFLCSMAAAVQGVSTNIFYLFISLSHSVIDELPVYLETD